MSAKDMTVVYGPVQSRRFGQSLGINFLGQGEKICSFNCGYCDLGVTTTKLNKLKTGNDLPTFAELTEAIAVAFQKIHAHGPVVETICISGNGEPTLHPDFAELVGELIKARDQWLPARPVVILTNGALLDQRRVSTALNRLDRRIIKLDAGNEKTFKAFNAPLSRTTLSRVIAGTRELKDFVVQSLFAQGTIDNTKQTDVDDWIEVIAMLKPTAVQIHGMNRTPANPGLIACDEDTLHMIASRLERRTGIRALVTP